MHENFFYRLVSHYTEQYSLALSVSQIFMIEDNFYVSYVKKALLWCYVRTVQAVNGIFNRYDSDNTLEILRTEFWKVGGSVFTEIDVYQRFTKPLMQYVHPKRFAEKREHALHGIGW